MKKFIELIDSLKRLIIIFQTLEVLEDEARRSSKVICLQNSENIEGHTYLTYELENIE